MVKSYSKIYALGHRAINDLFQEEILLEEKIDGSFFGWIVNNNEELFCRSHHKQLLLEDPTKMFKLGVKQIQSDKNKFHPGWTYYGEYLEKPKHNTLAYTRVPKNNIIIFDIDTGGQNYLSYKAKKKECDRLGFECVPLLYSGKIINEDQLKDFLDRGSILGNVKIEGIVIKNYNRFTVDGKTMMGKFVSEQFKEKHNKEWKNKNPSGKDFIERLGNMYKTEARWNKAIQHLKENDELENDPKDIGKLIKEIQEDVQAECKEEIKNKLWSYAWPSIQRIITLKFPEYYKELLMKKQFEEKNDN